MTPLTVDPAVPQRVRRVPGRNETLAMLSAIMALMAMAIDLMLSAFDDMRVTFGLDPTSNEIAGVVTVFFMGLAVSQVFYGPITDRFGRKAVLTASIVVYIIGAVASALAPTLPALLAARFVWGIGAAGARVVATAIARDLYEGVEMAKAMSQIMAVFIMVPVVAPTLGAGIVALFPWQAVFWACGIWAVAMWLWTTRMPETLPPERRRRLDRADITESYLTFLRTRPTIWFSISSVFLQAVFTMYLASSELIVSEIFGRRSQFPLVFGAIAVGFGVGALVNGRVVGIFGVRRVITTMLTVLIIGSTGLLALTLAADGTPGFWVFMPALGALLAIFMFIMPNLNAEAMQPVPHIAGTVSSLSGALRMAGGAVLGGFVAARIDLSLTPFATALLVFAVLAGVSVWLGARTSSRASTA